MSMTQSSNIVIVARDGADPAYVRALSDKTGAHIAQETGEGLTLLVDKDGLTLSGFGLSIKGDFGAMLRRVDKGRLAHEMLVKLAKTKEPRPFAVDATAGMGEDAFLLAAAGYEVVLFESDPVIAALLSDALARALSEPRLSDIVSRMKLIEGDSVRGLAELDKAPDIVYLDPMFPARTKSGLVGKKLQLLQKLEKPCSSEEELLTAAIGAKPKKIIIKRPLNGPCLAGRKPSYSVKGKAIRYDCIVL